MTDTMPDTPRATPLSVAETERLRALVGYDAKGDRLVDLVRAERSATLAALAHIDALTAAVEALPGYSDNLYGKEKSWVELADVLAILRGES